MYHPLDTTTVMTAPRSGWSSSIQSFAYDIFLHHEICKWNRMQQMKSYATNEIVRNKWNRMQQMNIPQPYIQILSFFSLSLVWLHHQWCKTEIVVSWRNHPYLLKNLSRQYTAVVAALRSFIPYYINGRYCSRFYTNRQTVWCLFFSYWLQFHMKCPCILYYQ